MLGATGVDEEATLTLRHDGGRESRLAFSFRRELSNEAHVRGDAGRIMLHGPWWGATRLTLHGRDGRVQEIDCPARGGGYAHEAEAFMDMIRRGVLDSEVMPLDESLEILRVMDGLRARRGIRYPFE